MTNPTHHLSTVSSEHFATYLTMSWSLFFLLRIHLAEGPHRSVVAHSLYQSLSFLGVPDHKVCACLMLLVSKIIVE